MKKITGGQILMKALAAHNVERAFSVAGESYLPALDAALDYPQIQMITCRQESGVTFGAESYGLLTGKPGIAFVTRGPGACNASIGVHAAKQSSSPMIMFVGLVRTIDRDKEAFQEFDIAQMFASHTKWASVIDKPERIGEYVAKAMHIATSGRKGPVVLGLPENILSAEITEPALKKIAYTIPKAHTHDIKNVANILSAAKNPMIIAGGSGWSDEACVDLASFAAASHIPVSASFRRQDIVDHKAKHYVGELGTGANPKLIKAAGQADVVLVLNARLNEMMSQSYTLFNDHQQIIHIYPGLDEIGKAYAPDHALCCDINAFMPALASSRVDGRGWAGWRDELRKYYEQWSAIDTTKSQNWDGADMTQIFAHLRENLPDDAIITTDAGNFSGWCQRYIRYGRPNRLLAPLSGAMGYCVPSAISASLEHPDRKVVGFCGDGGFMMTSMELATAMHHGAKPIIIVCNNNMYGTIAMHQQRDFPNRPSATKLTNPDFVKLAQSYGALGMRVEKTEEFAKIWETALTADQLTIIEIKMDPKQITTQAKL